MVEAEIVLHTSAAGRKLYLALDEPNDIIERLPVPSEEEILRQDPGDHDTVSARSCARRIHVCSADDRLAFLDLFIGQPIPEQQRELDQARRGRDLVVVPVIAEKVVVDPVGVSPGDDCLQLAALTELG